MPFIAIKYPYPKYQLGQNSERYHGSRKWHELRDFYVKKNDDIVTSLSRNNWMSWFLCHEKWWFRDFPVTKQLDVVTSMSWKMMMSWLRCHEIIGCRDLYVMKNDDFVTSLSRKNLMSWLLCHEELLFRDFSVSKTIDFVTFTSRKLFNGTKTSRMRNIKIHNKHNKLSEK